MKKEKSVSCRRCGACCCDIPVTPKEIAKIKQVLINNPELAKSLIRPYDRRGCFFLIRNEDKTTSCAIYNTNARPAVCVVYATKGLKELACPFGTVSTEFTLKEAKQKIHHPQKQLLGMKMINFVFEPFVRSLVGENILEQKEKPHPHPFR